MDTSGIGGLGTSDAAGTNSQKALSTKAADDAYFQSLVDYFFESPGERMFDNWLSAHGVSKEQYDMMTPEEKEALQKKFADEIERKAEEKARAAAKI
ncbi:MAG: hypothetical protein WC464_06705 [Bdellovibrionales bacterium]